MERDGDGDHRPDERGKQDDDEHDQPGEQLAVAAAERADHQIAGQSDTDSEDGEDEVVQAIVRVGESDDDPHAGRTYEIGGPEKLTLAEVAELAWAAKNKPVSVLPVPMALAGIGLSMLDLVPGAPMGSDQYRSLKFDNTTQDNDVDTFGWEVSELTTLQSYLGVSDADLEE